MKRLLALMMLAAAPLGAQRTHVLIVTGLGGEPQYSARFAEQGAAFHKLASEQWGVADSSLIWLSDGRATKEAVGEAFLRLSNRVSAGDLLVVLLIGHGSGEGKDSRVNLPGADATVAEYSAWLSGFAKQTVVFVNTASASGDFVKELKGPGRVIVTSTRTALERNESVFGGHFVKGLSTAEADANKDGGISVMEAFSYATREVVRVYEEDKRMLTEHATVSDSVLAARVSFGGATAASDDPRVVALVAERRAIEDTLATLRTKKDSMPAAEYEKELERLLIAIAEKTQAIRAAGGADSSVRSPADPHLARDQYSVILEPRLSAGVDIRLSAIDAVPGLGLAAVPGLGLAAVPGLVAAPGLGLAAVPGLGLAAADSPMSTAADIPRSDTPEHFLRGQPSSAEAAIRSAGTESRVSLAADIPWSDIPEHFVRGQQPDLRARVDGLVDAGQLVDAERAARDAGAAGSVALAEVLVLRGRLAEADSAAQAALRSNSAERRQAQVIVAELAARRGDRAPATRGAMQVVEAHEAGATGWSARDRVAAGRAYLLLAARDANAVRSALRAFDAAAAADASLLDASLRAADLLLEKYNAPDARASYEAVLQRRRDHPRAVLGLAKVEDFEGKGTALTTARRALEGNPSLTEAHLLIAKLHLEGEADDSARAAASRALRVDSSAVDGWATIGAVAWLRGDSAGFRAARAAATRLHPRPSGFYVTLADAASRQRRYAAAEQFSAQALALDSSSVPALGALGTNRLRAGDIAGGRAFIERAFEIDPFNLWHKNTLDLLDELATFRTVRMGRFEFVAPAREADILLPYLSPLLEEAYEKLAARYDYRPEPPVRLEIYERHADFSVRTVGLAGLGALGVSFGKLLAMDAPSARQQGTFNWGSTAWHELAHTFTLGLSGNRVPRWFSEGASVLEERRARPGWGADVSPQFVLALRADELRPVSALNDGFVRPRNPGEVLLSYYQASLVCEMIEAEFGPKALGDMLRAWGEGLETPAVLQRVLKVDEATLDRRFIAWLKPRFEGKIDPDTLRADADMERLTKAAADRERARDDAGLAQVLEQMIWIWPYDQETHVKLAEASARSGDVGRAVRARRTIVALGASDPLEARYQLARALLAAGDRAGARREVLGVLEQAPTFEKAQGLLLELRNPDGGRE